MADLVLDGIVGWDGRYEADLTYFTNIELHRIKQMTNLRIGEFDDAFKSGDNDILVAFGVVALERLGKEGAEQALWNAKAGSINFDFTTEEAAAKEDPPLPALETGKDALPQESGAGNGTTGAGGRPSFDALPETPPPSIGPLTSDIGRTSAQVT
jgi:hypothetical protein